MIFGVFTELQSNYHYRHSVFFGHVACGILVPQPGIEPTPPALEGGVLTTGPPGKSPEFSSLEAQWYSHVLKHQSFYTRIIDLCKLIW